MNTILLLVRWSARLAGLVLIGLAAILVVGHRGLPDVLEQPAPVQIEFLALFLMLAGFIAGWRWEGIGGGLSLAGFATFVVTELVVNGRFPGQAIPWFAIPAALLLASSWIDRQSRRQSRIPC